MEESISICDGAGNDTIATERVSMRRYEVVAQNIRKRIASGVLKSGDRLPSIRQMASETSCSVITVQKAYELLESDGICMSRFRSGFYVSTNTDRLPVEIPAVASAAIPSASALSGSHLLYWENRRNFGFGSILPSGDLFNRDPVDTILRQLLRRGSNRISSYHYPEGDILLRQTISSRLAHRSIFVNPEEIVITRSASSGFNLCIDTFSQPGDAVIIESPTYFPLIAGLHRRGVKAIEVPSHSEHGIDLDTFEQALKTSGARVCVLVVANRYPSGATCSREKMKKIVEIAYQANAIIIENDIFNELSFATPASSLKEFDESGTVVQFSSFGFQVHPEYGIGWIVAGKNTPTVLATQYVGGLQGNDGALQRAIAEHLNSTSGHEREMRKKSARLAERVLHGVDILSESLPNGTSVTRPKGGYMCWIEGPKNFSTSQFLEHVTSIDLSFFPGAQFSISGVHSNYLALNLSYEWTPFREQELLRLTTLMRDFLGR